MSVHGVTHLLTLNPKDFKRYTPTSPLCILAAWLILANRAATRPPFRHERSRRHSSADVEPGGLQALHPHHHCASWQLGLFWLTAPPRAPPFRHDQQNSSPPRPNHLAPLP